MLFHFVVLKESANGHSLPGYTGNTPERRRAVYLGTIPDPAFTLRTILDVNPLGGTRKRRVVAAPNSTMRLVHKHFRAELHQRTHFPACATGALPGCSPSRNVWRHVGMRYILALDMHDAYASVDISRLAAVLHRVFAGKYSDQVATEAFVRRYFCAPGVPGLAVGGPASPDLFNLYCATLLDPAIMAIANAHHLRYTRYLDDLTLSSRQPIGKRKRAAIRRAVTDAGFRVADHKTKCIDLRKGPVVITGVGLDSDGRMFLPRQFLRTIRGLIHLARKGLVSPSRVHGMMGVFLDVTKGCTFNRTERDLLNRYRAMKQARIDGHMAN